MASAAPGAREAAEALLEVVMLVMRSVAAEMRRGHQPLEPAHLGALMRVASGPCTISDVARHLNVTLPTASRSIDVLVRRRWVARTPSAQDRRRAMVALTPDGRQVLRRMKRHSARHIGRALAPLRAHDREALVTALGPVRALLAEGRPASPATAEPPSGRAGSR